jgi:hypothetical protein
MPMCEENVRQVFEMKSPSIFPTGLSETSFQVGIGIPKTGTRIDENFVFIHKNKIGIRPKFGNAFIGTRKIRAPLRVSKLLKVWGILVEGISILIHPQSFKEKCCEMIRYFSDAHYQT